MAEPMKAGDTLEWKATNGLVFQLEVTKVDFDDEHYITAKLVEVTFVKQTETCGFRWYYRVYDEMEYDICGTKAVGCTVEDDSHPGRCFVHLPNFEYMWAWGFIPQPVEVIELLDRPEAVPGV